MYIDNVSDKDLMFSIPIRRLDAFLWYLVYLLPCQHFLTIDKSQAWLPKQDIYYGYQNAIYSWSDAEASLKEAHVLVTVLTVYLKRWKVALHPVVVCRWWGQWVVHLLMISMYWEISLLNRMILFIMSVSFF